MGSVILYATRTGTRRNLAEMRRYGWRLFLTPDANTLPGGFRYALDNGAWGCAQRGIPWDECRFLRLVERFGDGADFVVLPDIVGGGLESRDLSARWIARLPGPKLFPVQDGMTAGGVVHLFGPGVGIFVGGSTDWKWATLPIWARAARLKNCHLHVGRVNTQRRVKDCVRHGVDSIDGTSASRFAVTIRPLTMAARQLPLPCAT